jgi:general nucleoside transport system permease protein
LNFDFRQRPVSLSTALIAIFIGILIGAIIIQILGRNPITVYSILINGAFGSDVAIASTLRWMTPLLFTAIASAIAFRGGMFNIGVEGQMYLGALFGALAGIYIKGLPAIPHIIIVIIASALGGMLWALIPALMKVYFGASEVVTTLMLNYVAILLTDYLVKNFFLAKGAFGQSIMSDPIQDSAKLPSILPPTQVHAGLLIGLAFVLFFYFLMKKSRLGYEISMSGLNPEFSRYGGININRVRMNVMLLSGAIGGVGGAVEVMGINWRFVSQFSPSFGFDGILASLLGGNSPIGVLLGTLFMGALKAGSLAVERTTDISRALSIIIQGVIICFVSARYLIPWLRLNKLRIPWSHKRRKKLSGEVNKDVPN